MTSITPSALKGSKPEKSGRLPPRYNGGMAQHLKVDLVGVGLNATDTLIALADFPARGSKTEYQMETIMPGGQVASTVVACQTWGLSTRYVGKLGNDCLLYTSRCV